MTAAAALPRSDSRANMMLSAPLQYRKMRPSGRRRITWGSAEMAVGARWKIVGSRKAGGGGRRRREEEKRDENARSCACECC
jgi:hypothetical protein